MWKDTRPSAGKGEALFQEVVEVGKIQTDHVLNFSMCFSVLLSLLVALFCFGEEKEERRCQSSMSLIAA